MSVHTLRQRATLDQSNQTLRFNRTMKEAGMRGTIVDRHGSSPFPRRLAIVLFGAAVACVAVPVFGWVAHWVR